MLSAPARRRLLAPAAMMLVLSMTACAATSDPEESTEVSSAVESVDPTDSATVEDVPTSDYPEEVPSGTDLTEGRVASYTGLSDTQVLAVEHCGNTSDRVLFTFDEGSEDGDTIDEIASWLKSRNYGAVFFPLPEQVTDARLTELRQMGFWVGNHSQTHPDLTQLDVEGIRAEIRNGVPSNLFRPPYGALGMDQSGAVVSDKSALYAAHDEGYRVCMWSVDSLDYDPDMSAVDITTRVLERVRPGDVVLFHTKLGTNTLTALNLIETGLDELEIGICPLPDEPTNVEVPVTLPCGS